MRKNYIKPNLVVHKLQIESIADMIGVSDTTVKNGPGFGGDDTDPELEDGGD